MKPQQPHRLFPDLRTRHDLGPALDKLVKQTSCAVYIRLFQFPLSAKSEKCGVAFHDRPPPSHDRLILLGKLAHRSGVGIIHAQRDQCRGVPKPHRPSPRSSIRAFRARPFGSFGLESFQKPFGSCPFPRWMSPARSRSTRCWGTEERSRRNGTIFATGFPRSVMRISSPPFTFARYLLREAFSSATAAVFMALLLQAWVNVTTMVIFIGPVKSF